MGHWALWIARARAVAEEEALGPETHEALAGLASAMCVQMADDLDKSGIQTDFRRAFYPDHLTDESFAALSGNKPASESSPDVPARAGAAEE
jgi:hypothetical protein